MEREREVSYTGFSASGIAQRHYFRYVVPLRRSEPFCPMRLNNTEELTTVATDAPFVKIIPTGGLEPGCAGDRR